MNFISFRTYNSRIQSPEETSSPVTTLIVVICVIALIISIAVAYILYRRRRKGMHIFMKHKIWIKHPLNIAVWIKIWIFHRCYASGIKGPSGASSKRITRRMSVPISIYLSVRLFGRIEIPVQAQQKEFRTEKTKTKTGSMQPWLGPPSHFPPFHWPKYIR